MTAWPQQSNGVYPGMLDASSSNNPFDPASGSMYTGANLDLSQFNNAAAMQQRAPNGNGSINPQHAFGNQAQGQGQGQGQAFQVNSVVPSKRPRPSDDGMAASPRLPQNNALNASRSQTPMQQQQHTPYPGQQQAQHFQAPNPYQHLQHAGSANATPSPTMQSQQFRPPQQPQRVSSASPATFNQMLPNMGQQMSPTSSNQNLNSSNASMTPQPQGQAFTQGMNGGQGFASNFGQMGGMMAAGLQGSGLNVAGNPQLQQHLQQRQQYQQRLLAQQQKMQAAGNMAGQRQMGAQQGQNVPQPGQQGMANGQPQQQQHSQQQSQQRQQPQQPGQPGQDQKAQNWLRGLAAHLQQHGKSLNATPSISGRNVSIYMIFHLVISLGGSQRVSATNMWPAVATKLGFPINQYPTAAQEIRQAHETYLSSYEQMYLHAKASQRQQQAQQQAREMAGLGPLQGSHQGSPPRQMQNAHTDGQHNPYAQMQQATQQQPASQLPNQLATPTQKSTPFPPTNGMATAAAAAGNVQPHSGLNQHRRHSSLRKTETTPAPDQQQNPSPAVDAKTSTTADGTPKVKRETSIASAKPPPVQKTEYEPQTRSLDTHGGYDILPLAKLGADLLRLVPDVPSLDEMGVVDIRALTLSLQSGIHAEVRYAIDHLVLLSLDSRIDTDLERCEDLADVLIDCAEEQIDILAEHAAEVSDGVDLPSYEDLVRSSRAEAESLQDVPAVGTPGYEQARAAERLIGLTTILRNLSFAEINHGLLSATSVITFISNAIRLVGTRNMLLRTFANTADFYKDVITYLSNITGVLELPCRDDALHVLHFLLAFAPQPAPTIDGESTIRFNPYVPVLQRYLPHAVDCLAKLLARQDPNRAFYRTILTVQSSSHASRESLTSSDLLTRAFALAISVLPDRSKGPLTTSTELRTVEARKAILTQGMLAADILASLIPSSSNYSFDATASTPPNLARIWLESEDRWACGLLRMAYVLSTDRGPQAQSQRGQPQTRVGPDGRMQIVDPRLADSGYGLVTHRGLGMLKRLVEKAGSGLPGKGGMEDDDDVQWMIKGDPIPHRETLIGALLMQNADKEALKLLCQLYGTVSPS